MRWLLYGKPIHHMRLDLHPTVTNRNASTILSLTAVMSACFLVSTAWSATWRSPEDLAYSPDGKWLAVSDHTAGNVVIFNAGTSAEERTVELKEPLMGVAWGPKGERLYATTFKGRAIVEIDRASGKTLRRFEAGLYPRRQAVAPGKNLLLVTEWAENKLRVIDLKSGKTVTSMRAPCFAAFTTPPISADFSPSRAATFASSIAV